MMKSLARWTERRLRQSTCKLFAGTDIDIDEKEEVIDMCKAWEEQKNEGRELGREEGRELGREEGREEERKEFLQKICSLIQKKLEKGKTISEIADDLEDTEENISHLIEQFHLGRKES